MHKRIFSKSVLTLIVVLFAIPLNGWSETIDSAESELLNPQASFKWIQTNIFGHNMCMSCHSTQQGDGDGLKGANFDTYAGALQVVTPYHPELSKLYDAVVTKKMPKDMPGMPAMYLSTGQLQAISDWIAAGAPNN